MAGRATASHVSTYDWIPQTRLQPPRLRPDLVDRPYLLDKVRGAIQNHQLTLVSAPAGYGKTTLVATVLETLPDVSIAWLSLHEEDNHPLGFLYALLAALRRVQSTFGSLTETLLASLPNPEREIRKVAGVFINEIVEIFDHPTFLVLDDLHLIQEASIYTGLDYLLGHTPETLRVVVATRHDPPLSLARLRSQGKLAEIRIADLQFTQEETDAMFNRQLGFHLDATELEILAEIAEGWIAGLHLLASSLDRESDTARAAFLHRFGRSQRHIFELLATEVLDHQPPPLRAFLLQTSILDELTPSLCRAVTGQSEAATLLEEAYRRNLFLAAVPPQGVKNLEQKGTMSAIDEPSYRYHALFAGFLRHRLLVEAGEQVNELHGRAAMAETLPARRIAHYLAAQRWEEAAQFIEKHGRQLLHHGRTDLLRQWTLALPYKVRQRQPGVLLHLGVGATQRGDLDEADNLLNRALEGFTARDDEASAGETLVALANLASARHDHRSQAGYIEQAMTRPLSAHSKVHLLVMHAWRSIYQGQWEQVDRDITEAIRLTLSADDLGAFNILALQLREPLLFISDGPNRLESYCRTVLQRFGEEIGPVQAGAHALLSGVHLWHGNLRKAEMEAQRAEAISGRLGGYVFIDLGVDIVLTTINLARGDYAAVDCRWKRRLPHMEQSPGAKEWLAGILCCLGRNDWFQQNYESTVEMLKRAEATGNATALPEGRASRNTLEALVALQERRYARAEALLRETAKLQQQMRHTRFFTNARLLLAYFYYRQKRTQSALSELAILLAECESSAAPGMLLQEGPGIAIPLLRLAVEHGVHAGFAARALRVFGVTPTGQPQPMLIPETGEALTPREAELLRLIAAGHSNRAIAAHLVITERTVKSHVTNILRKLNVFSRGQAVARARELGIL